MGRYRFLPPIVVVAALLGAVVLVNMRTDTARYSDTAMMMDTIVEVSIWGNGSVPREAAVDSAFASIASVADLFGDGMVDSRTDSVVMASQDFKYLLEVSKDVYRISGGYFDPTVGSVTRLWDFWENAEPPPGDSIRAGLEHVGLEHCLAAGNNGWFIFDVGGIAKGLAVDRAAAKIRSLGFRSAIINAGGDLALVGRRPDGKPWRIAIRHPRRNGGFMGYLDLEDVSVATSGDYEQYFFHDGKRYHHILDPSTGMPGRRSNSVTVVAPGACLSDALATALFLMGPHAGMDAVGGLAQVEAVFAFAEGESVAVSSGLTDRFTEVGD
jgi:thiamine biosynthesis lipoprotein